MLSSRSLGRAMATCFAAALALAAHPALAAPTFELTTTMGDVGPSGGAGEYLVRVHNPDAHAAEGTLELQRIYEEAITARATYHVPPGGTAFVRMPVADVSGRFEAVARSSTGIILARAQEHRTNDGSVIVFEVPPDDDRRLREVRASAMGRETMAFSHAAVDQGVPVLTERAAAYDGTAMVLVPSNVLGRLVPSQRDALLTWVRTGGLLGIAVVDPGDLSQPTLTDLVGDGVRMAPDEKAEAPTRVSTFWGGRVKQAPFGATASLGLGSVQLLAADPWAVDPSADVWLQTQLVALAAHRPARRAESYSGDLPTPYLDPNEGYRSVLAIAGVLLLAHAVVSALAFRRLAARRGMGPAYRFVAAASALTFGAVLGLGVYAKGGRSARARELTFAETASGENVAWIQRYRSFYAGQERTIDVVPRDAANFLVPLGDRRVAMNTNETDAFTLSGIAVKPWRATTVREDGTMPLGGGVSLSYEGGDIVVRNATGGALHDVLVSEPRRGCLAFGPIAAGETARSSAAHASTACSDPRGLGPAWDAYMTSYRLRIPDPVFPEGRTTLLAELVMPDAPSSDSGFRVERRATILRVIGGSW